MPTVSNFYHQPTVPYPNIRDWSGLILESGRYPENDFGDRLMAQITGGISYTNIKGISNRLTNEAYPLGWPEVRFFDHAELDPTDPTIVVGTEKPEYEVGEVFEKAFPCAPMRLGSVNAGDSGWPVEGLTRGNVRAYGMQFGTDVGAALNSILNSDEVEDEEEIDAVFFSPVIRMWDLSEAGKHYLFDFFKKLHDHREELGLSNEDPLMEVRAEAKAQGKPKDEIPEWTWDHLHSVSVRHEDVFNILVACAGIYVKEFGKAVLESDSIYYVNQDKFEADGVTLKEEYYASSADIAMACGYIAHTHYHVERFVETGEGIRALPMVPDDHERRDFMRVDSPVRYRTDVFRPESEDGSRPAETATVDTLLPGRYYEVADDGSLIEHPMEIPVVLHDQIMFYRMHEGGIERVQVVGPKAAFYVFDPDEDQGFLGNSVDLTRINDAAVPFFPAILEDYKTHTKSDAFAASWHVTVSVYEVYEIEKSWFNIIISVITLALYIFMPPAGAALTVAVVGQRVVTVFIMFVIAKIAYGLFADDPLLATLVMIGVGLMSGNYGQITNMLSNQAVNLGKMLLQFGDMLQKLQQGIYAQDLQGDFEELQSYEDQLKQLHSQVIQDETTAPLDPGLFYQPMEMLYDEEDDMLETTSISLGPMKLMSPELYLDSFLKFTSLGEETLNLDKQMDEQLSMTYFR